MSFEEDYQDVLQNIEFAIISVYREHPELTDSMTDAAIEGLTRVYNAEAKQRQMPRFKLTELEKMVYERVHAVCEMRLGRASESPLPKGIGNLTLAEIIACLKRIRSSISLWTKEYGKHGYLNFVKPSVP